MQPLPQEDELPEDGMDTTTPNVPSCKISPALVGGMVLLQQMAKKPETVVTVRSK